MGCKNSTLAKRRDGRPTSLRPAPASPLKISKSDFVEASERLPTPATESPSTADSNHVQDGERRTAGPETVASVARQETADYYYRQRDGKKANWFNTPAQVKMDRHRTSAPSTSAISTKIFKYKRSTEKISVTPLTQPSKSMIEKSSTDGDVRAMVQERDSFKRKLSTPAFSTPAIVVDEVPPSAPLNGAVCSNSTMWDMLTTRRNDDSQEQPANGHLTKHRFSFGRQRSNDKMVPQLREVDGISDDWVLKIIRCFPFPSPRQSPKNSPPVSHKALPDSRPAGSSSLAPATAAPTTKTGMRFRRQKLSDPTNGESKYGGALGLMVRVS